MEEERRGGEEERLGRVMGEEVEEREGAGEEVQGTREEASSSFSLEGMIILVIFFVSDPGLASAGGKKRKKKRGEKKKKGKERREKEKEKEKERKKKISHLKYSPSSPSSPFPPPTYLAVIFEKESQRKKKKSRWKR